MAQTLTLTFDEYPDDEIVVRLSPVPLEDYFSILDEFEAIRRGKSARGSVSDFFRRFGDVALISWTLPGPATGEGLLRQDYNLALAIVVQWIIGVRDVPLPLPRKPSAGDESEREASRPDSLGPS